MQGRVGSIDEINGGGSIVGDDGLTYRFEPAALNATSTLLRVGHRVEFVEANGQATEIVVLQPSIRPDSSSGAMPSGGFDLGRVIQRTFSAIAQNWVAFLALSALLAGLPSALQVFGQFQAVTAQDFGSFVVMAIGWVLAIVGTYMLQGIVVLVTVNGLNGKTMNLGGAFAAGASVFLPLFGLAIIMGLGMALGFLLLIAPGIFLMVLWSVASPVVVVEKRGIFESLQRSRDLSRGYRWPIFGLMVIYGVASIVFGMLVGSIGMATGGSFATGSPDLTVNMAVTVLSSIITSIVASAGVGALYYELRSIKEGIGPEQLASVFD